MRFRMPNGRVIIHQPIGTAGGKATEMSILVREMVYQKIRLKKSFSRITGKPLEQIELDTDRDNFMNPWEAKEYGLINEVIDDGKPGLIAPTAEATPPLKTRVWDLWKVEGSRKAKKNLPSENKILQNGCQGGQASDEEHTTIEKKRYLIELTLPPKGLCFGRKSLGKQPWVFEGKSYMNLLRLNYHSSAFKSSLIHKPTFKPTIDLSILEFHLKQCQHINQFNQILSQMVLTGFLRDTYAASRLIKSSTHFPFVHIDYTWRIFNFIENTNCFMWNMMMRAYIQTDLPDFAFTLYKSMLSQYLGADNYTYPLLIQACSIRQSEWEAKQI